MKLQDKVAIVTGSAQSIGRAVALRYAQEGAKVVVNDIAEPGLADAVVAEIIANGGEAFAFRADVTVESEVSAMVTETINRFGALHILVNNAAIDPRTPWLDISVEEWDRVMNVNVRSQFICAKAVFPQMEKQGYGKIINVSSVVVHFGKTGYLHYVASKGAIIGFTRALAREVGGQGITVNCVTPGAVKTETELEKVGSVEAQEAATEFLIQAQAIPRRMELPDIVGAFVFLASPDSDFITGQVLNADGGWMMH